jgi:hypothetical protein
MSGGANRRFRNDPVNFIRNYPLLPSTLESKIGENVAGVVQVNIALQETLYIVTPVSNSPSKNSNNFPAYFLKYKDTFETRTTLGKDADYFFTDSLSGCTVSCGTGPNPLVIHYNLKDPTTGNIDQPRINSDILASFGTNPHGVVRKSDYLKPGSPIGVDNGATVVGVRDRKTGNWAFYYQVFDANDRVIKVQQL